MICTACGVLNSENATTCGACGGPVTPRARPPAARVEPRAWPGQVIGGLTVLGGLFVLYWMLRASMILAADYGATPDVFKPFQVLFGLTALIFASGGLAIAAVGIGLIVGRGWAWVSAVSVIGFLTLPFALNFFAGNIGSLPAFLVLGGLLAILLEPGTRAHYKRSPH